MGRGPEDGADEPRNLWPGFHALPLRHRDLRRHRRSARRRPSLDGVTTRSTARCCFNVFGAYPRGLPRTARRGPCTAWHIASARLQQLEFSDRGSLSLRLRRLAHSHEALLRSRRTSLGQHRSFVI
eukprot:11062667-Heterocapsa_arctica.AAC.1